MIAVILIPLNFIPVNAPEMIPNRVAARKNNSRVFYRIKGIFYGYSFSDKAPGWGSPLSAAKSPGKRTFGDGDRFLTDGAPFRDNSSSGEIMNFNSG